MHNVVLETERLMLRTLTLSDAEAVFQWVSDERVARYMVYPTYENLEQVNEWLKTIEANDNAHEFGFVRKSDGLLIGSGSVIPDKRGDGWWGFGYNFRHDCWRKGYATEAVKAMIDFAHKQLGACKFTAAHAEPNKASGRVMEKCGLHFVKYGEFQKLDGSCKMPSMIYEGTLF